MNTNHQHSKEDEEDDLQLQFDSIDNLVPTPYDEDHPQITTGDIPPQEEKDQPKLLHLSSNPHNASSAEQCGRGKQVIDPHQNGKIQEDLKNTGQQPDGPITTSSDSDRGILDLGNNHNGNNGSDTASGARKGGSSSVKRFDTKVENGPPLDVVAKSQLKLIQETKPCSELEIALSAELERKNIQIEKLTSEVIKLKQFISKRKQTYKRKRKEDGAPTRALSAYNIFVQERFEQLARQNEEALMSSNTDKTLQRVPPASLVAQAGNEWRELPPEQKEIYKERAKADKKRYEEEMQKYSPPETQTNQKRNNNTKTTRQDTIYSFPSLWIQKS
jgi:Chromatin-associated proteins containing the HMG domain